MTESSKRKDGGVVIYVNKTWCNQEHITVKEQRYTWDNELFAVSLQWYYARHRDHCLHPPLAEAAAAC